MTSQKMTMRISFNEDRQEYEIRNLEMQFSLDSILERVNEFIIQKQIMISNFLDIELDTPHGFQNIYQFLQGVQQKQITPKEEGLSIIAIDIRLIDKEPSEDQKILKQWNQKIDYVNKEKMQIQAKIKENQKKLQSANEQLIDLAFFYAAPLVKFDKIVCEERKQVSYQAESISFRQKIQENGTIRDACIKEEVATVDNINKYLGEGVKIMHFSCHGSTDHLCIEKSDDVGMVHHLTADEIIELIKDKPPMVIVFNACKSKDIAQKVQQALERQGKQITTIGHSRKVPNYICQLLADVFYPLVFNGTQVSQAFKKVKEEIEKIEQTCKDLFIFPQNSSQAIHSSQVGANIEGTLKYHKKKEQNLEDTYRTSIEAYHFMNYHFNSGTRNTGKKVIICQGNPKMGKTLFIKKSLFYLKERGKVDRILYIDLKHHQIEINHILWFQWQFEERVKQFIDNGDGHKITIVLDHCDQIIAHQPKEFSEIVKEKFHKRMILGSIIIIVSKQIGEKTHKIFNESIANTYLFSKKDFFFENPSQFEEFFIEQSRNEIKKQHNAKDIFRKAKIKSIKPYQPGYHLRIIKSQNIEDMTQKYLENLQKLQQIDRQKVHKALNNKEKDQLKNLTNGMSKQLYQKFKKERQDYAQQFAITNFLSVKEKDEPHPEFSFEDWDKKILEYLQRGVLNIKKCRPKEDVQKIIRGIRALIFYSYDYIKKKKQENFKNKFMTLIFRMIGFCYVGRDKLDELGGDRNKEKQLFHILETKIVLFLYCLSINKDFQLICLKKLKYIQEKLKSFDIQKTSVGNFSKIPTLNLLKIFNDITKIKNNKLVRSEQYVKNLKMIENFHRQAWKNQIPEDLFLYGQTQIMLMKLPLLKFIGNFLQQNIIFEERKHFENIKEYFTKLNFLEQEELHQLFDGFKKQYVELEFDFYKLRLSRIDRKNRISRKEINDKFNNWVNICQKNDYKELKDRISTFKSESFNSCVALTSFPLFYQNSIKSNSHTNNDIRIYLNQDKVLLNPLRLQTAIHHIISDTFENKIKKTVFPRMDIFAEYVLEKCSNDNLPILISLFFIDCDKKNKGKIYMQDVDGCSSIKDIDELKFFKSQISIFVGNSVGYLREYFQKNLQKSFSSAYIFIDTRLAMTEKDKYEDMIDSVSIFEWVMLRLITIQILQGFYSTFCEIMFNISHPNFQSQINKAFQMGKVAGRIKAKTVYGLNFDSIINDITEQIYLFTVPSQGISQPLKINQINKNLSFKGFHQNKLEIGYNLTINHILEQIYLYKKRQCPDNNRGTLLFVLHLLQNHNNILFDQEQPKDRDKVHSHKEEKKKNKGQKKKQIMTEGFSKEEQQEIHKLKKKKTDDSFKDKHERKRRDERKMADFFDSLKIKIRKMAVFADIIDGKETLQSTSSSNLMLSNRGSHYGRKQENSQDQIMIIQQKLSNEEICRWMKQYKTNDQLQVIKNRVVIFTTQDNFTQTREYRQYYRNDPNFVISSVEKGIYNQTIQIAAKVMDISKTKKLKEKEFHCNNYGVRRVERDKSQYLKQFIRLMDDIKRGEQKEEKKEKKEKKKNKKPMNIKARIEEYLLKMIEKEKGK